ncbi:MAG: hypothetical protein HY360_09770 [Verrucomicrobia bacterium]|nr:hypothetical protein [Verrucomicrobiota bacterium]
MSYYLPALVWAHRVTGDPKYLKAFHRMHEDYLYNPDWYLAGYEMPGVPTRSAPQDRLHRLHAALRWSAWVAWLSVHAPNANYYQHLFDEFAVWNTRLLRNTLPSGFGHDYDNMAPTTAAYPEEWIDQPLPAGGTVGHDGLDIYAAIGRARIVPFRKLRAHSYFALVKMDAVDVTVISAILSCCRTPDHFTYWYDPEDKIVPPHLNHRSWSLQSQFVTAWLTAYWRLRGMGALEAKTPVGVATS